MPLKRYVIYAYLRQVIIGTNWQILFTVLIGLGSVTNLQIVTNLRRPGLATSRAMRGTHPVAARWAGRCVHWRIRPLGRPAWRQTECGSDPARLHPSARPPDFSATYQTTREIRKYKLQDQFSFLQFENLVRFSLLFHVSNVAKSLYCYVVMLQLS